YSFAFQHFAKLTYQEFYAKIAPQTPTVTIKDGKLSTPENHPYTIVDPDSKMTLAVIDASGQYKTIQEAKAPVLITQTEIIMQQKDNETRIYSLPGNFEGEINPQFVNAEITHFLGYAFIPIFIFCLIGFFIYRVLQGLIYAVVGKIFAVIFKIKLSYF